MMSDSVFLFFGGGLTISLIIFSFLPIDKILRKMGMRNQFRVVRERNEYTIEVKEVGSQSYYSYPFYKLGLVPCFEDREQAIETMNEWAEEYAQTDFKKAIEENKVIAKSK